MMNIKPVSDLRNYNNILKEVKPDQPLFLTKNGRGKYAVIDIEDYDRFLLGLELSQMAIDAKASGVISLDEAFDRLDL